MFMSEWPQVLRGRFLANTRNLFLSLSIALSSVGYHGESGNRSNGSGKSVTYGSSYGCSDVIGCGINYIDQCYFFTRNGKHQGKIFS